MGGSETVLLLKRVSTGTTAQKHRPLGDAGSAACAAHTTASLTPVTPQTGVTHIIRLIYIHNTAHGDEHDNLLSAESEPCRGERKTAEKKFGREKAVLKRAKCFDTHGRRSSGSLPYFWITIWTL